MVGTFRIDGASGTDRAGASATAALVTVVVGTDAVLSPDSVWEYTKASSSASDNSVGDGTLKSTAKLVRCMRQN